MSFYQQPGSSNLKIRGGRVFLIYSGFNEKVSVYQWYLKNEWIGLENFLNPSLAESDYVLPLKAVWIQISWLLQKIFLASSSEPKGQLTWNLVGSIGVTCTLKIAKIVPMGNPRWPLWPSSWKSIFSLFSWNKMPVVLKLDRNLIGSIRVTRKSK